MHYIYSCRWLVEPIDMTCQVCPTLLKPKCDRIYPLTSVSVRPKSFRYWNHSPEMSSGTEWSLGKSVRHQILGQTTGQGFASAKGGILWVLHCWKIYNQAFFIARLDHRSVDSLSRQFESVWISQQPNSNPCWALACVPQAARLLHNAFHSVDSILHSDLSANFVACRRTSPAVDELNLLGSIFFGKATA